MFYLDVVVNPLLIVLLLFFIYRLIEETHLLMQRKVKMQKKLEKNLKFQRYLDKVLEVAEEVFP